MGSSSGPTFANYYMAHLEENAFDNYPDLVPTMYARYVDVIFLVVNSYQQLLNIKSYFENNSVLKFTYEEEKNNKIAFLDVLLTGTNLTVDTCFH